MEFGLAITCPRSTSSFSTPRSSSPTLSPARPSSSSFLNISTPVTTVFLIHPFRPSRQAIVFGLSGAGRRASRHHHQYHRSRDSDRLHFAEVHRNGRVHNLRVLRRRTRYSWECFS